MVKIVSVRYNLLRDDIEKNIEKMSGIVELLANMGSKLHGTLAVGISVAYIQVYQIIPLNYYIKILPTKTYSGNIPVAL